MTIATLTTTDALVELADRAAVADTVAVVLDQRKVPWLLGVSEDGDTFARTMPSTAAAAFEVEFDDLLEAQAGAGVTVVWPAEVPDRKAITNEVVDALTERRSDFDKDTLGWAHFSEAIHMARTVGRGE